MNNLYIECNMGAAGDMLTAALLELFPEKEKIVDELNALGVPGVKYVTEKSIKCGIVGTHMTVLVNGEEEEAGDADDHGHNHHDDDHEHHHHGHHHHDHDHDDHDDDHDHDHDHDHHHDHEHHHDHDDHDHGHNHGHHHHTSMHDIEHIVNDHLNVDAGVKKDIIAVYRLIAEAESAAHDRPVDQIHFHEVGNMDAVADISAVCYLIRKLAPEKITVSPIHVGSGQVKCAHGILPVPAPATAYILKGIPSYSGNVRGELCTPTGAALLKHFANDFGPMPVMKTINIGYGMGKKDFDQANCVRVIWGETVNAGVIEENKPDTYYSKGNEAGDIRNFDERISQLSCNVDDMSGEEIGFAFDRLFEAGAREVFTESVYMKKNRPGTMINVICTESEKDKIIKALFKYTTTIGIRESKMNRYVLDRKTETIETKCGPVRCKISSGYGAERRKYEYDDIARIAKENDMSISEVVKSIKEQGNR